MGDCTAGPPVSSPASFSPPSEGGDDAVQAVEALAEEREAAVRPVTASVGEFDAQPERACG